MFAFLGQLLLGWFAIDLVTGVYHYVMDHRKPTDWLIGGQVADFMAHHADRQSMAKASLWSRNWMNAVASLLALLFAWLWPASAVFWVTVWLGGTISQEAHQWAHAADVPKLVRALQKVGVLISPEAHERHHSDFERCYGVLNGWSHGTLDLLLRRSL